MPSDEMFMPNPLLMGVISIGPGVVLWWLVPDMARREEEVSRFVWGRLSPFRRWPVAMRGYHLTGGRVGAVFCVVAGIALLVAGRGA